MTSFLIWHNFKQISNKEIIRFNSLIGLYWVNIWAKIVIDFGLTILLKYLRILRFQFYVHAVTRRNTDSSVESQRGQDLSIEISFLWRTSSITIPCSVSLPSKNSNLKNFHLPQLYHCSLNSSLLLSCKITKFFFIVNTRISFPLLNDEITLSSNCCVCYMILIQNRINGNEWEIN